MRVALLNPRWSFDGSIYFGCREPHLPLEFGYAEALLHAAGHEARLIDAHRDGLSFSAIRHEVSAFAPDMVVVTTAPSYLFWRCAPPELRVPLNLLSELRDIPATRVVIGPHVSTTPVAVMRKLGADAGVLGEAEEVLVQLASTPQTQWGGLDSLCYRDGGTIVVQGKPHQTSMPDLPPLRWPQRTIELHQHHHHRFDKSPEGPGGEMEVSRGCPYHCTFCAKDNFRNDYRKRPLHTVLTELDALISGGVRYVYFIDEIFLPDETLLRHISARNIQFGIQTRIDLWKPEMLALLGAAGCVSIEAGIESISAEGRDALAKHCRMSTAELINRLCCARDHVPFVQANLIHGGFDDPDAIEEWRRTLASHGVWANKPVPLFPYPGSPDYTLRWGAPDDLAWERAHQHYLDEYSRFSDIQEEHPLPLTDLERVA